MNIPSDIKNLMVRIDANKSDIINKKAVNKVMARLEEAWLWSKEISPNPAAQLADSCVCFPGAIDQSCPVHMGTR